MIMSPTLYPKAKAFTLLQQSKWLCYFLLVLFTIGMGSCSKSKTANNPTPEVSVKLDKETSTLMQGDELKINVNFTPTVNTPNAEYKWQVADSRIADVKVNADFSVNVTAKNKGETEVALYGPSGKKLAACLITVQEKPVPDDGIVKILAIGNSFSEDALESYLYGLANSRGHKIVIGNLYIGGASLSLHLQNASNNANAYAYRKINQQGIKATTANVSIAMALADDNWDYISFQQESPSSGLFNTFAPLVDLYNYVKTKTTNPSVKYVLHQTWAYQKNATYSAFNNYDKNQDKMYAGIVDAYIQAKNLIPTYTVVPAGTAIQNGRTSVVGDNFCRDGYHLDINIGRYTAACTWFESIFKESVVGNAYKPSALSDYHTEIAQNAAHLAVLKPNEVTQMVNYQGGGTSDFTKPILVNFGGNSTPSEWNSLVQYTAGTSIANLRDQVGANTNISITIVEGFNNRNQTGPTTTNTSLNMPSSVSSDSYYGNSKAVWESKSVTQSVVKLTGLNTAKKYSLCFFGSRANSGTENRETKYTVKGTNEVIALLDAANNTSNIACAEQVAPNTAGEITITITAGSNNNNAYGFYYINALQLKQVN
ncbi:DUF4886 domain-containing protein [Pedobacter chitinilyticus]|uniref:DUF4886 domain-containing protein n=2 Tax=Pedobacter chitinilyticus TaxID=2233776 RepID=A0A3S3PSA3_9SPHI|nr:DUF4886 domain-containing protein [Pedobacter chitinilyticus]